MVPPFLSRFCALSFAILASSLYAQEQTAAGSPAERYRPLIHFSPSRNWTNDPCGLYYSNGFYHVFFQYNPQGDQWGHMSWGHASSPDMIRWLEHPVALNEENGVMMFTGSAVVDKTNSSGLCQDDSGCPILIYTGHEEKTAAKPRREHQNLAAGDKAGRVWKKYAGNPVLDEQRAEFRDPKVFWHDKTHRWIMVVALADEHKAAFYWSRDLKDWKKLSEFGPAGAPGPNWECPEFFELPVDGGSAGETRWVLKIGMGNNHVSGGSGEQYFVGKFDGERFVNDNPASTTLWFDYGRDCYCALSFNNTPKARYAEMLGWMNNWSYAKHIPTAPFRGQMTIPRRVSLRKTADGVRVVQQPVLRPAFGAQLRPFDPASDLPAAFALEIDTPANYRGPVTVKLSNAEGESFAAGYDRAAGEWFADRRKTGNVPHAGFPSRASVKRAVTGAARFQLVVDTSSVEMFAASGEVTMTHLVFPNSRWNRIEITGEGGARIPARIAVAGR